MDDDFIIAAILFGVGFVLWKRLNSAPGTFSPTPPNSVDSYSNAIVPLTVSPAGIAFIKQNEGISLTPYGDAGHTDIGYGHQEVSGENYSSISTLQADNLLANDLIAVENTINNSVTVPLSQNQFDALADFVYNVGPSAFASSTLLQKLNSGDYAGAASQFAAWINSNGQVSQGLVNRRGADTSLFNTG